MTTAQSILTVARCRQKALDALESAENSAGGCYTESSLEPPELVAVAQVWATLAASYR